MQNVHLSPPQIAQLFDVNVSTVKRWFDKGFITGTITSGGHRRVTKEDLADFISRYPRLSKKSYVLKRFSSHPVMPTHAWKEYYKALLDVHSQNPVKIVERAFLSNIPLVEILEDLLSPTLRYIGEQWEKGNLSIYQEHRMSFIIRQHLFRLDELIPQHSDKRKKRALIACVDQEFHEIPLQMLSLVFRQHGWHVDILGISTPFMELTRAADTIDPQCIAITKVYSKPSSLDYLNTVARYAKRHRIHFLYGGRGWAKVIRERSWDSNGFVRFSPTLRFFDSFLRK